jgi:phosphoserine aminotransferase
MSLPNPLPPTPPTNFKKNPRTMFHQVIQKVENRLHDWQRGIMSYSRRELHVKTILSSLPIYFLTVFKMPTLGYAKIDRFRRNFL